MGESGLSKQTLTKGLSDLIVFYCLGIRLLPEQ